MTNYERSKFSEGLHIAAHLVQSPETLSQLLV